MISFSLMPLKTIIPCHTPNVQDGNLMLYRVKRTEDKNSSGDEIANVNFFYNIAHVEAIAYAH